MALITKRRIRKTAGFVAAILSAAIIKSFSDYELNDAMIGLVFVGMLFMVDFMHNNIPTPLHILAAAFFVFYNPSSIFCESYGITDYVMGFDLASFSISMGLAASASWLIIIFHFRFREKDDIQKGGG